MYTLQESTYSFTDWLFALAPLSRKKTPPEQPPMKELAKGGQGDFSLTGPSSFIPVHNVFSYSPELPNKQVTLLLQFAGVPPKERHHDVKLHFNSLVLARYMREGESPLTAHRKQLVLCIRRPMWKLVQELSEVQSLLDTGTTLSKKQCKLWTTFQALLAMKYTTEQALTILKYGKHVHVVVDLLAHHNAVGKQHPPAHINPKDPQEKLMKYLLNIDIQPDTGLDLWKDSKKL